MQEPAYAVEYTVLLVLYRNLLVCTRTRVETTLSTEHSATRFNREAPGSRCSSRNQENENLAPRQHLCGQDGAILASWNRSMPSRTLCSLFCIEIFLSKRKFAENRSVEHAQCFETRHRCSRLDAASRSGSEGLRIC